jgi:hypothetical protein
MELIIQLFRYKDRNYATENREREFIRCFSENLSRSFVNKVHVFLENPADENFFREASGNYSTKCSFIRFGSQPTYKNLLEYADSLPDYTIFCIMNSDILLDETMDINLVTKHVCGMNGFGLTRHEYTTPAHEVCNMDTCIYLHDYSGSHDMFMLQTPLLKTIDLNAIDFNQDTGGAEAIFQRTLSQAGYKLKNPAYQIRGFHIHSPRYYFKEYPVIGTSHDYSEKPSILT